MNTETLSLFIDVARQGSFASVARRRDLDPSSVSRTIAALEAQLQIRLFHRSTRKLSLTDSGQRYLQRIEPLLEDLMAAQDEAKSLNESPTGRVRLTSSIAFGQKCIVPCLKEFTERYPKIQLNLLLTDENLDFINNDIDLACRLSPRFDSELIGAKLFDTHYSVCASPEYLKVRGTPLSPDELGEHKCIVFDLPLYRARWLFRNSDHQIKEIKVKSDITLSSALALRECALMGLGPVLLADWLIDDDIRQGNLVNLFPDYRVTATDFETAAWLLYPSRQYLPNKTRVVRDFLKEKLFNEIN